jgi:hypothetical protein
MIAAELTALREQIEAAPDAERRALKRRQRELTAELESLREK